MTLTGWDGALETVLVGVVLLGVVPLAVGVYQSALVGLHRYRSHYDRCGVHLPRTVVLIPAWNEAAVLASTIDHLVALDYPPDRLRVYVVDDASTDATPAVLAAASRRHPGVVVHLRRERGGQGKAHTLNHGIAVALADDWMEALLITDADVVFEPDALRKMARHLADPEVGAVTLYIKEGSRPGTCINRFVAYEYAIAQASARRAHNVLGAMPCLAGGAQLHSRENVEAIGGRIDTSSHAEDTITTILTQLRGRKVVFEPNAVAWAEEPGTVSGLWKQRLRWARGNLQVTRRFAGLWLRRHRHRQLGSLRFAFVWFVPVLQPALMVLSSLALVTLFVVDRESSQRAFGLLWISTALSYVFIASSTLAIDLPTARRTWRQAVMFPGLVSVVLIGVACFPALFAGLRDAAEDATGLSVTELQVDLVLLFVYVWVAACMAAGYLVERIDDRGWHRLARALVYVVGFGPILCAVAFDAYLKEAHHAELRWDKTEKVGVGAIRS